RLTRSAVITLCLLPFPGFGDDMGAIQIAPVIPKPSRRSKRPGQWENQMPQNRVTVMDRPASESGSRESRMLAERLFKTRKRSLELAAPLTPEDMVVQAMDDASPTKWHLAHVTWFFENFVLKPHLDGYRDFDDAFNYCFN